MTKFRLPRPLASQLLKWKYRGTGVECPVCGGSFRSFAPFGVTPRENALCPGCGSLERHRLLWIHLQNSTKLMQADRPLRVLHMAPEEGIYWALCRLPHLEYVPGDLFPEYFQFKGPVPVRKLDVTALPFPDRHFDVVICNHVFEVVPDDLRAMQETRRVMKDDGWGIFQSSLNLTLEHTLFSRPTDSPEQRKALFGWEDIRRWYARDYADVLGKAGFSVEVIDPFLQLKPGDVERFGLMPSDRIYQGRRAASR